MATFPPLPANWPTSDVVDFIKASPVETTPGPSATELPNRSFNIGVIDLPDVEEPEAIYTGMVAACGDNISVEMAEEAMVMLNYTPPPPPTITYDLSFPQRPELQLASVHLPDNQTDTSTLASMGGLYDELSSLAESLVDNILAHVSTDPLEDLNSKLFSSPMGVGIGLRGIDLSTRKINRAAVRAGNSLGRQLDIITLRANHSHLPAFLQGLNTEKRFSHATHQQARLDNSKLNVSLAMQGLALSLLIYNNEVENANLIYAEYFAIIEVEVNKLNLYGKHLKTIDEAQQGNTELIAAYRKQLSVVQQVFETLEQEMNLAEIILKLTSKEIEVETANIDTTVKLISSDVELAENKAYQVKTKTLAEGLEPDGILVKAFADLMTTKVDLGNILLDLDTVSKNSLIDAENDLLTTLAESAAIKARAVGKLFKLQNESSLHNVENAYSSSHTRTEVNITSNSARYDAAQIKNLAQMATVNDEAEVLAAVREAGAEKLFGLANYLQTLESAAELIREARVEQTLIHTIKG